MSISSEIHKLSEILDFKIPMDGLMTAVTGVPVIDIITLDERLMRDYNYDGSMMKFIEKQFGKEAKEIIEKN